MARKRSKTYPSEFNEVRDRQITFAWALILDEPTAVLTKELLNNLPGTLSSKVTGDHHP